MKDEQILESVLGPIDMDPRFSPQYFIYKGIPILFDTLFGTLAVRQLKHALNDIYKSPQRGGNRAAIIGGLKRLVIFMGRVAIFE